MPLQDDFDEDRKNVDKATADKVFLGLDYPCYPQLPGPPSKPMNMALQFLIPLSKTDPAIQIKGEDVHLVSDRIHEPSDPVGIERAEYYAEFLRERGLTREVRGIKACVTGPFTVAGYIDRKNLLSCGASKTNVVTALAHVLSKSCEGLSDLGFDLINIDEPFLSVMLGRTVLFKYDQEFIIDALNLLIDKISGASSIHVCGTVTPLVKAVLLRTEADIVDHEFAGCPANLRAYTAEDLERSGKFLAYGCVSSVTPRVETIDEISASLMNALNRFGPRIIVKPDCGFGGMLGSPDAYASVLSKLKNMVYGAQSVRDRAR